MADWKLQYPSTTLSRRYDQGDAYVNLFRGEALKLLYELKNLMRFRNLDQLKMTRIFTDGTVVTAWSVFGQDFINIDTSRTIGAGGAYKVECTITLINFPEIVQPTLKTGRILASDVQGIDYWKTYYTVDVTKCPDCQDLDAAALMVYGDNEGDPVVSEHYDSQLTNHSIYSLEPPCYIEIVDRGTDKGGTYIRWRPHTEARDMSGTGLAVGLFRARIFDTLNNVICSAQTLVRVDCCQKSDDARKVEIWWDYQYGSGPFMWYGDKKLYRVFDGQYNASQFVYHALSHGSYYALPEIKGGCIPFDWKIDGGPPGGHLVTPGEYRVEAGYEFTDYQGIDCNTRVRLELNDRCETKEVVNFGNCCDSADAIQLLYATLQMGCGDPQSFYVQGGCPPYKWTCQTGEFSGGGKEVYDAILVGYNAPSENPDCANNDTITVSDCCGSTASIQIAVNCLFGPWNAFSVLHYLVSDQPCGINICFKDGEWWCQCDGVEYTDWFYNCDGSFYNDLEWPPYGWHLIWERTVPCDQRAIADPPSTCVGGEPPCTEKFHIPMVVGCNADEISVTVPEGTVSKYVNAPDKALGCCPINPETGLPF